MLQQIIDRRLSGKNKSIGNRERFLHRHSEQIRDAVRRAVSGRGIRDIAQGEDIHIPRRDISEPVFGHGPGGRREAVHPGNTDYVRGDRIARPRGGQGGSGGGSASDSGQGEDDFIFHLTKDEFMRVFFDDLALPNLVRTTLAETPEYVSQRAGFSNDGTPNNLDVVRSMRGALGRRIAVGMSARRELAEKERQLAQLRAQPHPDDLSVRAMADLEQAIELLRRRIDRIPYLDPFDLRYRSRVRRPVPTARAVMFCLMDVSGSMDEARKDLAKRFFILMHLFLTRHYEKIDIVFIRHHTQAQEVDEETFFRGTESGGTVVSSALVLMNEVIQTRYPRGEWNIYGAYASDGDNWNDDSPRCRKILADTLLPLCRYFAYVQVAQEEQTLWHELNALAADNPVFAARKATDPSQIYPVFRNLFKKEGATS